MQYNGGKAAVAKELATLLASFGKEGLTYWEPFVGAAHVISRTELAKFKRVGSDSCKCIISYLKALQMGWLPPENISEEEYHFWKNKKDEDNPMVAHVGFGCSFGGKFFGGYARSGDRNYAKNAYNSAKKQVKVLEGISFISSDYREYLDFAGLIYCDPPYAQTTKVGTGGGQFDTEEFWQWTRMKAQKGSLVFVTEFKGPEFAEEIWMKQINDGLRKKDNSKMVERLFLVHP